MTEFLSLLSAYTLQLAIMSAATVLLVILWSYRDPILFWRLHLWYGFPVVGKLKSLSGDVTKSPTTGWFNSEESLCHDYKQYIHPIPERDFLRSIEYLRKAGDTGRKPLSAGMMLLLGVLIAAESLGFSFLLSTSMAQEGSANLHAIMTFAITSVIAIVFAFFMHLAGHQLHRFELVNGADKKWRVSGQTGPLESKGIDLNGDQTVDDNQPQYVQLVNRIGDNKSRWAVWAAAVLITLVFVGSTYMRIQHLNSTLIQEAVTPQDSGGNPFANGKAALPDEAKAPQAGAEARAASEQSIAQKGEGYAAFIVLGVIFVFTQFVGVAFGMKFGFAGKQGKPAYDDVLGSATYEAYMRRLYPRIHKAEARLRKLQQAMAREGGMVVHCIGSFAAFLARDNRPAVPVVNVGNEPAPIPTTPTIPTSSPPIRIADEQLDLRQALAKVDSLPERAQKEQFILALPDALRALVIAEMKARKARLSSELDGVF